MADTNEKEQVILNNIESREAWEVLKTLLEEQMSNQTMPADMRDVFFTEDHDKLMGLTLSNNCVIAALAKSRVFYDGEAMGMSDAAGKTPDADCLCAPSAEDAEAPSFE